MHDYQALSKNINKSIAVAKGLVDRQKFDNLVICGDFNYPYIEWSVNGGVCKGRGRPASIDFLDTINDCFLTQFVLQATMGTNILDLVFSDDPDKIYYVAIGPHLSYTHKNHLHSTLLFDYHLNSNFKNSSKIKKVMFSKGEYGKINEEANLIWDELSNLDVDHAYSLFLEKHTR